MKKNDNSFDNTKLAANPITNVKSQTRFPKRDAWSDFEYSFLLLNRVSIN